MPVHVGQTSVYAVVPHGHKFVINAQQVQHGGVYVVDLGGVFAVQWLVAPLVALAMGDAALYASASEPVGEYVGVMVTPFLALRTGHTAKLGCPMNDRVFQQAALLEVLYQACGGLGHAE